MCLKAGQADDVCTYGEWERKLVRKVYHYFLRRETWRCDE